MAQVADAGTGTLDVAAEERRLRVELAAGYRLADKYGMSDLIYTHISLRVPGPEPTYLMKPHDLLFEEVTASNLVRVDLEGNAVDGSDGMVNRAGVAIHGAILEARPDVNCVFHTHTPYATAVSSVEGGLLMLTQAALRFKGRVAFHDYSLAATDPSERSRLAEDMGDAWVMLLQNHGLLTTGKTVGEAFVAAYYLENACQFQVLAQAAGRLLVMPAENMRAGLSTFAGREDASWAALLRKLDREDPSYRD
jgi:ribulose-5-phosphate 4-epimerase/fuculose-1-phosphate aldolase